MIRKFSDFLFENKKTYDPMDKKIIGLKRIDKIDFSGNIHLSDKTSNTKMIEVNNGDLVISGVNVAKGSISVYSGIEKITATIHFSSYKFDKSIINIEYFKKFVLSENFIKLIKQQVKGGIKTEIKSKHILPLQIDLPNITQQDKIVKKFENIQKKLMLLNEGKFHREKKIMSLKKMILDKGILGDLSKNKKKINKKIPENWRFEKLGKLIKKDRPITYGIIKLEKEPLKDGIKVLRCSDVLFRKIDKRNIRKVLPMVSNKFKRTILEGSEIVMNIRGTLGGCAIIDKSMKGYNIAREVAVIAIEDKKLINHVLNVLTSNYFDYEMKNNLRGMGRKGLNLNILREILIPIPPENEIMKLNELLEKNLNECKKLEELTYNINFQSIKLQQTLINRYFN